MEMLVVQIAYAAVFAFEAVRSYAAPVYDFKLDYVILLISVVGVVATVMSWKRELSRWDWLLPIGLIVLGLASFPGTSRDHLRYLFDGEMIRMYHLSPYVHLPLEFPIDQYSAVFQRTWWTAIPSPYGPLWQGLMVFINFVSGNRVVGGVIALKLVNLGGLLLAARYIYLITGKRWLAYVLLINPVILINSVATPHPDIVIAALLLAAYHHQKAPARGLMVAVSTLIKPHALIFLPFLAKTWRARLVIAGWTAAALAVLLLALKPAVGFDWLPMLRASQGGANTDTESMLMRTFLPTAPWLSLILASYALFLLFYATILGAYLRRKISQPTALALTSLLIPLCLTGLVLPWHFIIPITCLLLSQKRLAEAAVIFLSLFTMWPGVTVTELIGTAAFCAGIYLVWRQYLGKIYRPSAHISRMIGLMTGD